jgi:hypothetical protein
MRLGLLPWIIGRKYRPADRNQQFPPHFRAILVNSRGKIDIGPLFLGDIYKDLSLS